MNLCRWKGSIRINPGTRSWKSNGKNPTKNRALGSTQNSESEGDNTFHEHCSAKPSDRQPAVLADHRWQESDNGRHRIHPVRFRLRPLARQSTDLSSTGKNQSLCGYSEISPSPPLGH